MKLQTFSVFFIFAIIGFLGNIHVQANSDRVALLFAGESNTYLFGQSGEAIIIDAGADPNLVISAVVKAKLTVKYIILTHAHHDHIPYVNTLRAKLKAKVILHQKDLQLLRQTSPDTIVDAVAVGGEPNHRRYKSENTSYTGTFTRIRLRCSR